MKKIFILLIICMLWFTSFLIGYNTTTTTPNLSLIKIASGDITVDIFDTTNSNMDLIDAIFDTVSLTEFGYLNNVTSNIQTQLDAKATGDFSLYYLKTQIDTLPEMETIWGVDVTTSTELASALTLYYLKTAIDTQGEMETIWGVDLANNSDLHAAATVTTTNGLSISGQEISLQAASNNTHGALTDTDWNTFNSKQDALTFGISDTNKVQINSADVADNDYAKFTATGVEGRSYSELLSDIGAAAASHASLHAVSATDTVFPADPNADKYLMWDDDPGALVWATVSGGGYTNLTSFVDQTAWRLFYSNTNGDVTELALGADGTYLKSNGATSAPTFDTPAGGGLPVVDTTGIAKGSVDATKIIRFEVDGLTTATTRVLTPQNKDYTIADNADFSLYYLKTAIDTKTEMDAIWGVTIATTANKLSAFAATTSAELAGVISDETGTGALVFANAPVIDFYNALGTDHLYSGDIDSEPVGETVAFGQLLYFNWTDKEWKIADADASTTMPGLRIALETKADGQTCKLLVKGYIRDDSAFEFAGAMVYASQTAGAMTSTAPSSVGNQLQRVGQAKSADVLFFDPSIDVGEI